MTTLTVELPRPARHGLVRLVVNSPSGSRRLRMEAGATLTLGAAEDADVRVDDRAVSARHCRILHRGSLWVEDLGSRNGVFVRGARIERAELIGERPEFRIGETTVAVEPLEEKGAELGLVGRSASMDRLRSLIRRYARASAPVLILGESGTGKDLVARALHAESGRSGQYLALNVAALPDSLVDAELFGHVRGSFTGAVGDRPGAFELADRGTLFLDEIAELSPTGQAKLLRVVEDKVVRPIGAKESQIVDARIVAATCIDLPSRVRRGEFRLDLYHRLGALVLEVPPLRRRTGDIPLLVKAFLQSKRAELGERVVEPRALRLLMEHPWSGNVRELFAQLYRAALHAPSAVLTVGDFSLGPKREGLKTREQAEELIREMGSVAAAARYAGVPRTTFRDILRTPSSAKTDDDALEDPR